MAVNQISTAIVFRTPCNMKDSKKFQKGFTFVELMVIVVIVGLVASLISIYIRPLDQMKKSRDNKRLSDTSLLDRVINEYLLDNKIYPDQVDILRKSNVLPSGSLDFSNSNPGWIYENLSKYTERLPIDPLNDDIYFYSYIHNETGYEINVKLEYLTDEMAKDGGNSDDFYEIGNNLNLISP